jgi:hypothetical protein
LYGFERELTELFGTLCTRFEDRQQSGGPALQSFSSYRSVIGGYGHVASPLPLMKRSTPTH